MLFQPTIIALLLASGVAVAMLAAAAPFAVQVIRQWDIASGSERQLQLERRTYLFSTLAAFVMAVQLVALLLFVFNADRMSVMFVGAMCAVGTLNVNAWGFPALLAQMAVFLPRRVLAGGKPRRHPRAGLPAGAHQVRAAADPLAGAGLRLRPAAQVLPRPQGRRHHLLLRQPVLGRRQGPRRRGRRTQAAAGHGAVLRRDRRVGGTDFCPRPHAPLRLSRRGSQRRRLRRHAGRRALLRLALHLRAPQPPLPVLHPQAGIRSPGLLALPAAVRRHRRRAGRRRAAAVPERHQPARDRAGGVGAAGRRRRDRLSSRRRHRTYFVLHST